MTDQAATIERLEQELGDARLASDEWQAAAAGLTRDLRMAEAVRDRLAAEVARLKREAAPAARITAAPSDLRVCGTCADLGGEIPLSVHSRECAAGHGAPLYLEDPHDRPHQVSESAVELFWTCPAWRRPSPSPARPISGPAADLRDGMPAVAEGE